MDTLQVIDSLKYPVKMRLPRFTADALRNQSRIFQERSHNWRTGVRRCTRPENEHDLTHSVGEWDQKRRRSILFDWFGAHLLQRQVPVKVVPNRSAHSRGWSSILAKCRKS